MNTSFIERLLDLCSTDKLPEVAKITGVPYNTLKNYHSDPSRLPSAEVLIQIARATGANLNWLLLGEGPQKAQADGEWPNHLDTDYKIIGIEIPAFNIKIQLDSAPTQADKTEALPVYKTGGRPPLK